MLNTGGYKHTLRIYTYFFWEAIPLCISDLYNILCTINTQHISRQDAIITIRLYLATCFGRNRPSSGQLRTILRYSKNSTQWDPISFTIKLYKNKTKKNHDLRNCVMPHTHTRCNRLKVPVNCDNDTRIPLCCWHIYSNVSVWTIVRPEYSTWRFSFTILPCYSTALIISKNFHILSSFNVNEMGSHWVLFLLYLNIVLSWPEDGRLGPKHVAKYNLNIIINIKHWTLWSVPSPELQLLALTLLRSSSCSPSLWSVVVWNSKGFGFVAFFASVKASSVCIHLSCLVCL